MKKLTIHAAVILSILIPSILILSCQQQPTTSRSPMENDAGWTIFTNSNRIYNLLIEGNALWAATEGGLVRWDMDKETYRKYTTLDGLAGNDVRSIGRDKQGNLWFGTVGGLSRYDGSSWITFTASDALARNVVTAILQDKSGNMWFGTMSAGVACYDGTNWRTFTTKDGLANDTIYAIVRDPQGNLWFGTRGGVSRYDGTIWRTFTTSDGLGYSTVTAIGLDKQGNLWFGTLGGISRYNPTKNR